MRKQAPRGFCRLGYGGMVMLCDPEQPDNLI
jgi:hypothetical protein